MSSRFDSLSRAGRLWLTTEQAAMSGDLEQHDLSLSSDDETTQVLPASSAARAGVPFRRAAALGLGLVAFVACGSAALLSNASTTPSKHGQLTARMLFEHADVHEVAADNILKIRKDWFGQHSSVWPMRRLTEELFRNASRDLSPDAAKALDNTPITMEQKDAVVHAMRYLSDRRLQKLGHDVAKAVKIAAKEHPERLNDPEQLKKHIAMSLGPSGMEEIRKLSDEMYPSAVAKELNQGGGFEHLLDPKRIQFMAKLDDGWDAQFTMSAPEPSEVADRRLQYTQGGWGTAGAAAAGGVGYGVQTTTDFQLGTAEEVLGVTNAVLEEANAMLRILRPCAKMFGNDVNVPPMVTSAIGAATFLFGVADCEINAMIDGDNPVEMAGCPMEFGSEGFDACRELFALTGLLGDNNPDNGVQGNHNTDSTVHQGIFDDP